MCYNGCTSETGGFVARIPYEVQMQYKPIDVDPRVCIHCGAEAKHTDFTPYPKFMNDAPEMPKTSSRCCGPCYQRIYYANVALEHAGRREGAGQGLMTDEAKRRLCGGLKWARTAEVETGKFIMGFQGRMVVPSSIRVDGEDIFVEGLRWTFAELVALQGPMALRMVGASEDMVTAWFWIAVMSDEVEKCIDVDRAMDVLGIKRSES